MMRTITLSTVLLLSLATIGRGDQEDANIARHNSNVYRDGSLTRGNLAPEYLDAYYGASRSRADAVERLDELEADLVQQRQAYNNKWPLLSQSEQETVENRLDTADMMIQIGWSYIQEGDSYYEEGADNCQPTSDFFYTQEDWTEAEDWANSASLNFGIATNDFTAAHYDRGHDAQAALDAAKAILNSY